MNKLILISLFLSLLIANAAHAQAVAQAQSGTNTVIQSHNDAANLAMPEGKTNLYIDAGLAYMRSQLRTTFTNYAVNYYGGTASAGWRINKSHKIQLDFEYLSFAKTTTTIDALNYKTAGDHLRLVFKRDYQAMPLMLTYGYCFPLANDHRWELQAYATAGYYLQKINETADMKYTSGTTQTTYPPLKSSGSKGAFAGGAKLGVTYHINEKMYAEAGFRYMYVGSMSYEEDMGFSDYKPQNTYSFFVKVGWKFAKSGWAW